MGTAAAKKETKGQLRIFSLSWCIFLLAAALFLDGPWNGTPKTFLLALSGLSLAGIAFPTQIALPFFRLFESIGVRISWLVFAVCYYFLITPFALVLRLSGRDALNIRQKDASASGWTARPPAGNPIDYFRQF